MYAYHGRYLRVDLTAGTCAWNSLAEESLRRFLGGVGLGAYLLAKETKPGLDPFSPDAAHSLTLASPTNYSTIQLLEAGAGTGPDIYNVTVHFNDGGSDTTFASLTALDWFDVTDPSATGTQGLGRLTRDNTANYSGAPSSPRLFEQDLTLSGADAARTVQTISVTRVSGGTINVFAVSGNQNLSGVTYGNNVTVSANSTLDTQLTTATIGTLSMGAQTLTVTGTTGVNTGAVGFSGNPTISVAAGQTLKLGAVADGSFPRTINVTGAGAVTLGSAASSLVAGTAINVSGGGTLNVNVNGATGSQATVTLSGGSNLNFAAAQILGALNSGAGGGSVSLNSGTLIIGTTTNLSSTFTGTISGLGGLAFGSTASTILGTGSTLSYFGPTSVNKGVLQLDANLPNSSGVSLASGAKLTGTGIIGHSVSIASGGTLAPGDTFGSLNDATLTDNGNTFTAGATLQINAVQDAISGLPAMSQLAVTSGGTVALANATLTIANTAAFVPTVGQVFTIVSFGASTGTTLSGTFAGLPTTGSAFIVTNPSNNNQYKMTISYTAGASGHDVTLTVTAVSGALDHFALSPSTTTTPAGTSINMVVTALDVNNLNAANYTGLVDFTSSTDGQAGLPTSTTLTNDVGTVAVTFRTAGSETLTARDHTTPSLTGTSTPAVTVTALAVTHFGVIFSSGTTLVDTQYSFTVNPLDPFNNIASYSGTLGFTSTDSSAAFSGNAITFHNVGSFKITATDTVQSGLTGTSGDILVTTIATQFLVTPISNTTVAGVPLAVLVFAKDNAGRTATGFSGTVHVTAPAGSGAVVSPDATLTNGVGIFSVTLKLVPEIVGFVECISAAVIVHVPPVTKSTLTVCTPLTNDGMVLAGKPGSVLVIPTVPL